MMSSVMSSKELLIAVFQLVKDLGLLLLLMIILLLRSGIILRAYRIPLLGRILGISLRRIGGNLVGNELRGNLTRDKLGRNLLNKPSDLRGNESVMWIVLVIVMRIVFAHCCVCKVSVWCVCDWKGGLVSVFAFKDMNE